MKERESIRKTIETLMTGRPLHSPADITDTVHRELGINYNYTSGTSDRSVVYVKFANKNNDSFWVSCRTGKAYATFEEATKARNLPAESEESKGKRKLINSIQVRKHQCIDAIREIDEYLLETHNLKTYNAQTLRRRKIILEGKIEAYNTVLKDIKDFMKG